MISNKASLKKIARFVYEGNRTSGQTTFGAMNYNAILTKIRTALSLTEGDVVRVFGVVQYPITPEILAGTACPRKALVAFLEGLIVDRRGPNPKSPLVLPVPDMDIDFNDVFKKLRIALNMQQEQVEIALENANVDMLEIDLSAIFRKKGHKHYRACDDALLESFLIGVQMSH